MYRISKIEEKDHPEIYASVLKNQLHLMDGTPGTRSRMENIATRKRPTPTGITISCVYDDLRENADIPIAIAFCEHPVIENLEHKALLLKNQFRDNSAVRQTLPWKLYNLGFVSIYVDPGYRNLGIAKNLIREIEKLRILEISLTTKRTHPLDMPFFEARQGSINIVNKYSLYSTACDVPLTSINFKKWLHNVSQNRKMSLDFGHSDEYEMQFSKVM